MALATTCPQCQTSFKVVPDQLKLRKGLVRCGVCQHVFSGIDNLRYVSEPRTAPRPTAAAPSAESPDLKTAFFLPETVIGDPRGDAPRMGPGPGSHRPEPPQRVEPEPPVRPPASPAVDAPAADAAHDDDTARHARSARRDDEPEAGPEGRVDGAQRRDGSRDEERERRREHRRRRRERDGDTAILAQPGRPEEFIDDFGGAFARPRAGATSPAARRRLAIAVAALGVLLALQLALGSRDLLAARIPAVRPILSALGAPLGLSIELPRLPGKLTIESFELAGAGPAGVYKLDAVLRNRASHPVQWPAIELTLTDAFGGVVASKVLLPSDYQAGGRLEEGFPGNAEESVFLEIAIDEVVPSGYRAILFYP